MESRIETLVSEIKQLYVQYIEEVGRGGRKVWPKSIKERTLELDHLVGSTKRAAELSGLPADTLYLWRSEAKRKGFKSLAVVEQKPASPKKSVTVTVTSPPSQGPKTFVNVTVKTPKGYVIEGLRLEDVIEFFLKVGG